ncbi:acyl carrier protein [Nocardioides sp. SYSU DS0651]|uniref:acyl carrier protein n=1 Tax=Nocardioides sp. SYSU DS0651 TaxID=3415955 RepID=UPI003F4B9416
MTDSDLVVQTVRKFLRVQNLDENTDLDTSIYGDGLGLDSLQIAELSAMLEDALGRDPFTAGQEPGTLAEVVDFYAPAAS